MGLNSKFLPVRYRRDQILSGYDRFKGNKLLSTREVPISLVIGWGSARVGVGVGIVNLEFRDWG